MKSAVKDRESSNNDDFKREIRHELSLSSKPGRILESACKEARRVSRGATVRVCCLEESVFYGYDPQVCLHSEDGVSTYKACAVGKAFVASLRFGPHIGWKTLFESFARFMRKLEKLIGREVYLRDIEMKGMDEACYATIMFRINHKNVKKTARK